LADVKDWQDQERKKSIYILRQQEIKDGEAKTGFS